MIMVHAHTEFMNVNCISDMSLRSHYNKRQGTALFFSLSFCNTMATDTYLLTYVTDIDLNMI